MAGVGHAPESLVARPAHPDAVLVLAAHGALEVDPPHLAVGIEIQSAERNLDLDRPADAAVPDARVPDAVPGAVVAVRVEHRVGHQPRRVHLEEIPGPFVEERVDRPHETIVGGKKLVAPPLKPEPLVGLRIETRHRHVEHIVAERDPDFGGFGGRPAVARVDLDEVVGGARAFPDGLVENAVQGDAFAVDHALGRDGTPLDARLDVLLVAGRRGAGQRA